MPRAKLLRLSISSGRACNCKRGVQRVCADAFWPGAGSDRVRPPRRRLSQVPDSQRRSVGLRTRCERDAHCHAWSFLLSRARTMRRDMLAEKSGAAARRRTVAAFGRSRRRRGRAAAKARSNIPSTVPAATIAIWMSRPIRPARPARLRAKPRTNAAPGPMCGPATSARPRVAISRTRSRGRGTSRAVFPAS